MGGFPTTKCIIKICVGLFSIAAMFAILQYDAAGIPETVAIYFISNTDWVFVLDSSVKNNRARYVLTKIVYILPVIMIIVFGTVLRVSYKWNSNELKEQDTAVLQETVQTEKSQCQYTNVFKAKEKTSLPEKCYYTPIDATLLPGVYITAHDYAEVSMVTAFFYLVIEIVLLVCEYKASQNSKNTNINSSRFDEQVSNE